VKPRRRVALLMDIHTAYDHGVARGIMRFARERGTWRLFGHGWTLAQVRDPRHWDGHGIITRVHHPREVPALLALGVPVIDVCRTSPHPRIHSAANDDEETGRVAGRHFVAAGHRRFAFCGAPEGTWSVRRGQGFAQAVGVPVERMPGFQRPRSWWHRPGRVPAVLKAWIRRLERPVAILAGDDAIGVKLANACAELGIRVPDEVAIVGVDNEEVLCELANPALSSVPCDTERMGYEAAKLLDRLMDRGQGAEASHVAIPPLPIVVRGSSDRFATDDEAVLAALRLIHHADHPQVRVPQVVAASGLSRRALELRFRRELERTILDEIRRVRLDRACRLLETSDLPVAKVALRCGFSTPQRFHSVFRQQMGMLPSEYRRKHRP
jgi:LacI family transcriptional regulator